MKSAGACLSLDADLLNGVVAVQQALREETVQPDWCDAPNPVPVSPWKYTRETTVDRASEGIGQPYAWIRETEAAMARCR